MKKISLSILLMAFSVMLFAQEEKQDTLKARAKDWGVVLNLTGLINNINLGNLVDVNNNNTILVKHYLTNRKVLRFGLGVKTIRNNWFNQDSISLPSGNRAQQQIDSTQKRFDFSIAVGMEKHLGNTRRLDPYIAGELVIGKIGSTKIDVNTDITDVTGIETIQRRIQQDGGFNFGLNAIAGFNFFFSERISIGAEINLGYLYSTNGGDQSESLVDTPVSGAQISSFVSSKSKSSTNGFAVNSTAGLMLSFFF